MILSSTSLKVVPQTIRLYITKHSTPSDAMTDLETAIRLSEGKGRAACQAFTQRAMIHRLHGQDDLARADFQAAANLGSEFAKAQVSHTMHTQC